jgi:hypothetical protein
MSDGKPISLLPTVSNIENTDDFTSIRESDPTGTKNKKNTATQVGSYVFDIYNNSSLTTILKTGTESINEIVDRIVTGLQHPTGFPNRDDSEILYDPGTRQITLQPKAPATEFSYYLNGVKYTVDSPQVFTHPDTTGLYFFYIDATNTFRFVSGVWNIITDAPISYVVYNSSLADGFSNEERHSSGRNPDAHLELHFNIGTYIVDGFAISGYTVQPGSPTDADNTFALASGNVADEDIISTLSALADGGPYNVWYRSGATGEWLWDKTLTVPYFSGTYIQYNEFTGATWQLTELTNNQYMNIWVFKVPALNSTFQTIIVVGQNVYSTLLGAESEAVTSIDWGIMPFQEIAGMWQITFRTNASYTSTGQCRIEAEPIQIVGSRAIITGQVVTNHNSLSGLEVADEGVTWGHIDDQPQNISGLKTFQIINAVTANITAITDFAHKLNAPNVGANGIGTSISLSAPNDANTQKKILVIQSNYTDVTDTTEDSQAELKVLKDGASTVGVIIDGTSLKYTAHPTFTADTELVDKKYVDDAIVVENIWDRDGATIIPHNAGDDLELGTGDFVQRDTVVDAVTEVARFSHIVTSGTPQNNSGAGISLTSPNSLSTQKTIVKLEGVYLDVTDGSEDIDLYLKLLSSGAERTIIFRSNVIRGPTGISFGIGSDQALHFSADNGNCVITTTEPQRFNVQDSNNTSIVQTGRFVHFASNPTGTSFGNAVTLIANNGSNNNRDICSFNASYVTLTDGAEDTKLEIELYDSGSKTTALILDGTSASYSSHPTFTSDTELVDKKYVDDAIAVENIWDRAVTTISPHNAGDDLDMGTGSISTGNINLDTDTISHDTGTAFIITSTQGIALSSPSNLFSSSATQNFIVEDTTTNAVTEVATFSHTLDSVSAANNIGASISLTAPNSADVQKDILTLEAILTDITSTAENTQINFNVITAGADVTAFSITDDYVESTKRAIKFIHTETSTIAITDATTTGGLTSLAVYRETTGTATNDIACIFNIQTQNNNAELINAASLIGTLTDVSDGAEDSQFDIKVYSAGSAVTALTIDGTSMSPQGKVIYSVDSVQTLTAATTIPSDNTIVPISSASDVILTSNPQIAAGTNGQMITLIGASDTYSQRVVDGNGLNLDNGAFFEMSEGDNITFVYYNSLWNEVSRVAMA